MGAHLVLAAALGASLVAGGPLAARQVPPGPGPVTRTDHFELTSAPRTALFHFLRAWASADAGEWPPYAVPIRERDGWEALPAPDERRVWEAALAAIAPSRNRSLLSDDGLVAVRDWAAGAGARERIPPLDRPLADAIEAALPVYLRHWWPRHDARNRAWIDTVAPVLGALEHDVIPRLAAAYGGRWPAGRIPVDVVPYASPVGAYSARGRLTLSSMDRDNAMPQAVELVFHEASHMDSLAAPLTAALQAAFRAAGGEPPERFWHDVIFYTSGEITRIAFARAGTSRYRHYGEVRGVYARGDRWRTELPALRRAWGPFLESGSADDRERHAALVALAAEVLARR